jgi:hypothetical protein
MDNMNNRKKTSKKTAAKKGNARKATRKKTSEKKSPKIKTAMKKPDGEETMMFPRTPSCQECRSREARFLAEVANEAGGAQIHRFLCGRCKFKATRPAVSIDLLFSSPRLTIAILGHMANNGTDWESFGQMMGELKTACGLNHYGVT